MPTVAAPLHTATYSKIAAKAHADRHRLGYSSAALSWTLEDNDLINRTIESVGAKVYKRFRIYERAI